MSASEGAAPRDDGSCAHLKGKSVPSIVLKNTSGEAVDIGKFASKRSVIFFLTRVWNPKAQVPPAWKAIPGAVGEEEQARGFREMYSGLQDLGVSVLGVGTQPIEELKEFRDRALLPFDLVSDERFLLSEGLVLPTFLFQSQRWIRRLAFVADHRKIEEVWFPAYPPALNAQAILKHLASEKSV